MKSSVGHLQVNIDPQNLSFYKDLFDFMGWSVLYEDENMIGVGSEGASLWFTPPLKGTQQNHYDGVGLNHLALSVPEQNMVDQATDYLQKRGVQPLFNTPCHRPDFSSEPNTYYQVMFETPDRLLLEVVYTGLKS